MSFAAEVKDFLGSATSTYKALDDAQYNKIKRRYMAAQSDKLEKDLNDPTIAAQKQANLEATRENTRATKLTNDDPLRDKLRQAQIDAAKSSSEERRARAKYYYGGLGGAPTEDPVAAGITSPGARAVRPAIPTQPAPEGPAPGPMSLLDEDEDSGAIPTQMAARGGLVQKFADGGMVDDEDLDPNDEDDVAPAPAIGGSTDVSAQSRTAQAGSSISKDAAHDAVVAGLKYGVSQLGPQGGVPTAQRQQRLQALVRGAGAAPLADMNAIYKKIDPNNEMGESERNLNAMSAIYQYKLRQGDAQGAQRAAFMMLQNYRVASQRYAAIAAAAAEHGDIDGAAKAAMKAYANIPDGKDLKIVKTPKGLQYSFTDEQTGKVVSQGIASPQELAAAAMGVATKGFDQMLVAAAGERAAGKSATGNKSGGGAAREGDKEKALSALDNAYDKAFPAKDDKPALAPEEERAIKGNAYRIYSANPGLTHGEAIDITQRLMSPNAKKPEEAGFVAKKLEDGEGYAVKVGKGATIRVSEDDFDNMASARAEKIAALKKTKEDADKKGPGLLSEAAGAIGDYASRIPGAVAEDLQKAGQTEFGARAKSAIDAAGRAIGDAYEWAKDDLSKSSTLRGMMNGPGKDKF